MRLFVPKSYLPDVLGPYRGSGELPSLFERYLLDFDDVDDAAIEQRLEEVKRYWDKQSEHARYGSMIRDLAERHPEARLTLADASERARAVAEARGRAEEADRQRRKAREDWERLLRESVKSAGGLDPARRARLEKLGRGAGVPEEELRRTLDSIPEAKAPEVLDPVLRRGIADKLSALAQALEEPRAGRSLYHALGLELTTEASELAARREARVGENNQRPPGAVKDAWKEVLAEVKLHLLDADPGPYVNGLVVDVREALEQAAFEAIADDNVIDEVEGEQLRQRAIELGLSAELAQGVVSELAREHGAMVQTGEVVDLISCPACNHPHTRAGGAERCSRCGAALFVTCPGCGERAEATSSRCSSCGTDLHRYAAAARALGRLPALIAEGRVAAAEEQLKGALQILGGSHPELPEASRQVKAATEGARRVWAQVETARAERRQYAARRLLGDLAKRAKDFPGPTGELATESLVAVEKRIAEAEERLRFALQATTEHREGELVEVLRLAADCAEAEQELDKLPPEPPAAVEVRTSGLALSLSWAPSPTAGVGYSVSRVALPGGIEIRVGETGDLRLEDPGAPPGSVVRYRVTATRGRASSAPVTSEPAVAAYEVRDLRVDAGDGQVELFWSPIGAAGRVVVERREEGQLEPALLAPDLTGVRDREVSNGRRYAYRVYVEYPGSEGGVVRTDGQTVFAQPVERPRPLEELRVRAEGSRVELQFDPPLVGSVAVFRCAEEPDVDAGATVDSSRIAELGEQLPVQGGVAVDSHPPHGRCFYLPVTIAGNLAVAGAALSHLALPEVENARLVSQGKRALVTWTWPPGVTIARVLWRHDRRPAGPEDADAKRVDYRLGEYRDSGGFSIATGEHRSLFVSIFPAARLDGETVCGSAAGRGSTTMLRSEQKTEVRYSVRRVGGLRKRLEVEVSEPEEGALPELVLVGREGDILPRSASDGQVLARLGGDGPRCSSLEMRQLSRPLAVKLFLDSAGATGSHVLYDPMVDDLLIG